MAIIDDLSAIFEGKMPEGRMFVKTTNNAKDVELYGTNRKGFKIPLDRIEEFIGELEQTCGDPDISYKLGKDDSSVEIPGFKIEKTAHYLREARDIGIMLGGYQIFF
jgi:hypothetical protein